ncbi:hypothetical protein C7974DRAFT_458728 [Boeremia exigua]|uniref:uncharacterized protein n=1 Tax=Boeremia exigua TaxID=749465 RepID=UPI001E8D4CFA|nr:uncharacterized protein C7974DRAFT_458728 [Boeremia exigua]KAH6620513.1 hypothetical protein C7974DRAFT_458728 [Boeremia exigua]
MAPPHRRGGKHTVKDKDLTQTKYDDYSREQLLAAVKEAGCYVKDDKKSVMARKMADHDRDLHREENRVLRERKEKKEEQQREIKNTAKLKQIRLRAKAQRNEDRIRRREHEEDVSSDSDDTEDHERTRNDTHKLTVTGGEVLSDESWEDTSSETSVRSRNSPVAPSCRVQLFEWPYTTMPSYQPPEDIHSECFPSPIAYTPLKLVTLRTREKVTLPGLKYPVGIDPDFAPILSPLTRTAVRHGHKIGVLARATIERATSWAERTITGTKNARSKLLQPTPGVTDLKADRKRRCALRLANKRRMVAEVYEASAWQPLAMGYMPAYLDWEQDMNYAAVPDVERKLENLYYICFPGKSHWNDPTSLDPTWNAESSDQKHIVVTAMDASSSSRVESFEAGEFELTLPSLENELAVHGLSVTLSKKDAWYVFAHRLPALYPSEMCVAEKIVELLSGCEGLVFSGYESWTRDDSFWHGEEAISITGSSTDFRHCSPPSACTEHENQFTDTAQALHRRHSRDIPPRPKDFHIWAWLQTISTNLAAPIASTQSPHTSPPLSPISSSESNHTPTSYTCPFCSTSWTKTSSAMRASHMLSHSSISTFCTSTAASRIDAIGIGVKRRHSLLSVRTLLSYNSNSRKERKMLRVESAAQLVDGRANSGTSGSLSTLWVRR